MKLAWLTDPHLNFASIAMAEKLMTQVRHWNVGALLVGGDIGESVDLEGWLMLMQQVGCPIYFVLGNHDYYRSSITDVRLQIKSLCMQVNGLTWLSGCGVVSLTEKTALIGHDGWGDGYHGDVLGTPVMLSDFVAIEELRGLNRIELASTLKRLGQEAAQHLNQYLPLALAQHQHVIVLMHVPPFVDAAWHEGHTSDANWSPFFVNGAAGEVILKHAQLHQTQRITVLCGHTHSAGVCYPANNVQVITGEAAYRRPALQMPLWIE